MSATAHALQEFRLAFAAMLQAAEGVRVAIEADASVDGMGPPDVVAIQRLVAGHYQVQVMELVLPGRTAPIALARHLAMALCRELTPHTVQTIGRSFQRHHGIVAHAVRHVADTAATNAAFAADLAQLRPQARTAVAAARATA